MNTKQYMPAIERTAEAFEANEGERGSPCYRSVLAEITPSPPRTTACDFSLHETQALLSC